ncbi:MAG: PAS domain-containing protein [Candidatus Velthaea sp.]
MAFAAAPQAAAASGSGGLPRWRSLLMGRAAVAFRSDGPRRGRVRFCRAGPRSRSILIDRAASVHPDDRERAEREVALAVSGGPAFDTEFRVVWPNGEIRTIRALATLVNDAAGRPERMIGTNWDITEVRTLAEELRKEKDAATFAAAHDALTGLLNRRGLEA